MNKHLSHLQSSGWMNGNPTLSPFPRWNEMHGGSMGRNSSLEMGQSGEVDRRPWVLQVAHLVYAGFRIILPAVFFLASSVYGGEAVSFAIDSPDFIHMGDIPAKYTCEGEDTSPALVFAGAPEGTKSLALIVDDPDAPDPAAPKMTWVHWVLYDLPPDTSGLEESVTSLPADTLEGTNDWKRTGYGGPCPPIGRHRYFFKLYALDTVLPDLHEPTKVKLEQAMQGHVLAQTELIGTYQKK